MKSTKFELKLFLLCKNNGLYCLDKDKALVV